MTPDALAELIRERADLAAPDRFVVALVGPPGAGKSTLAAALVEMLGKTARAVPMDGFHYDDAVLRDRGLADRKGAPETFDVAGYRHLLARLRDDEEEVAIPLFDRQLELSRGAADVVTRRHRIVVTEGNYLLLDEPPWRDLQDLFDLTVMIEVPEAELVRRLMDRWAHHGRPPKEAQAWIEGNDLPNIRRVTRGSRRAEVTIRWS